MKKDNAVEHNPDPGFSSSGKSSIILSEYLFTRADFPSMHSANLPEGWIKWAIRAEVCSQRNESISTMHF